MPIIKKFRVLLDKWKSSHEKPKFAEQNVLISESFYLGLRSFRSMDIWTIFSLFLTKSAKIPNEFKESIESRL